MVFGFSLSYIVTKLIISRVIDVRSLYLNFLCFHFTQIIEILPYPAHEFHSVSNGKLKAVQLL